MGDWLGSKAWAADRTSVGVTAGDDDESTDGLVEADRGRLGGKPPFCHMVSMLCFCFLLGNRRGCNIDFFVLIGRLAVCGVYSCKIEGGPRLCRL